MVASSMEGIFEGNAPKFCYNYNTSLILNLLFRFGLFYILSFYSHTFIRELTVTTLSIYRYVLIPSSVCFHSLFSLSVKRNRFFKAYPRHPKTPFLCLQKNTLQNQNLQNIKTKIKALVVAWKVHSKVLY